MKKAIFYNLLFVAISFCGKAQSTSTNSKTLSGTETNDILRHINFDSTKFLSEMGQKACKCIDSIPLSGKSKEETALAINKCIDAQTSSYQMTMKLLSSLKKNDPNNKTISIDLSKTSDDYKKYYYQLEYWLKDSCKSLNTAINSENKESEHSLSSNSEALAAYQEGIDILKNDDYAKALPYFEKAVKIDSKFAFAWDNVGVCNRKLGNLDKALEAYQKSLSIDPNGKLPLQNIGIVYIYKKEFDKAIDAYNHLLAISPSDPEVFYGIGNVYFNNLNDMEKALDNMCKAYNLYVTQKSPYRVDAQKVINMIYAKLKADGKEELFYKILKDNNINVNKN